VHCTCLLLTQSGHTINLSSGLSYHRSLPLFDLALDQDVRKIVAMRRALQKFLALVLTAGLMAGGPLCAHTQMNPCGSATSHETHAVSHYADLSIDPEDGGSPDAQLPGHHHDDGLCKKCCATCVGANLPTSTGNLATLTISTPMALALDDDLVARTVPTEPGIPKPL
jgi:hypothetical protein